MNFPVKKAFIVPELKIVDTQNLSAQARAELDGQVDALIARQKNNRHEINQLVFEGAMALAAGNKAVKSKTALGFFKRHFTGKNNRAQNDINQNLVEAQYAAQQTLQKLAEQNLLSFELIAAVNNKLNAAVLEVNDEINDLIKTMLTFFKNTRAKIVDLETKLATVEQNVNLLTWQNSIEYQMYNGVEYQDLDDVTKIVCLVRDFYDITKGTWRTSDLLLLKTAMATVGLNPKSKICYGNFVRQVGADARLFNHLLGENYQLATEYETVIFSLNKFNRLATEENYLVQTTGNLLAANGINLPAEEIACQMTDTFVRQETGLSLSTETNAYEFILELLCNLAQLQYTKAQRELEARQDKLNTFGHILTYQKEFTVRELVLSGVNLHDLVPIILGRAGAGDVQARYMASLMRSWNFFDNKDLEKKWIAQNISAGDLCSMFRGSGYLGIVKRDDLKKYVGELTALADGGDVFAQYELASYYHYGSPPPPEDCKLMAKYFEMAADQGFAFAQFEFGFYRYYLGWGGEEDHRKAIEWLKKVHAQGFYQEKWIAECYGKLGCHDEQLQWLLRGLERDERNFADKLGDFYRYAGGDEYKNYAKAIEYYKREIEFEPNKSWAEYCIAEMYLEGGYGITASRSTARELMKKAAAKNRDLNYGAELAQKWLKDNPY